MSLSGILASKGAAVTFTKTPVAATYDSASDTVAEPPPTDVTVSGRAMGIGGTAARETDTRVLTATQRLVFQPSTAGQVPEDGSTCTWGGEVWSVRSTEPVAMNGTAQGAFVDLER